MTHPFFSIIVPIYNSTNVIHNAIGSVLNQSFQDFEIVIADDGSTDNGKEIVQTIGDVRIKYYYHANAGPSATRNLGAHYSLGEYFIFLDSDDSLSKDYLKTFFELLAAAGGDLGFATAVYVDANKHVKKRIEPWVNNPLFGPVLCGAYVISRKLFLSLNGFDPHLYFSENSDLFLRVRLENRIELSKILLNKEAAVFITTIDKQQRRLKYSKKKYLSVKYFLKKHEIFFNTSLSDFMNFKRIHALCALRNGDVGEAKACIKEIIKRNPLSIKSYLQYFILFIPKFAKAYYERER